MDGLIAHRLAWPLVLGVAALKDVPVLGHRCGDNPLCQRGPDHVRVSPPPPNRRE